MGFRRLALRLSLVRHNCVGCCGLLRPGRQREGAAGVGDHLEDHCAFVFRNPETPLLAINFDAHIRADMLRHGKNFPPNVNAQFRNYGQPNGAGTISIGDRVGRVRGALGGSEATVVHVNLPRYIKYRGDINGMAEDTVVAIPEAGDQPKGGTFQLKYSPSNSKPKSSPSSSNWW